MKRLGSHPHRPTSPSSVVICLPWAVPPPPLSPPFLNPPIRSVTLSIAGTYHVIIVPMKRFSPDDSSHPTLPLRPSVSLGPPPFVRQTLSGGAMMRDALVLLNVFPADRAHGQPGGPGASINALPSIASGALPITSSTPEVVSRRRCRRLWY